MVQAIKRDEVFIEPEGIHVETHQPERRSRKPPLLLVHGVLTGSWLWSSFAAYFAERGWEAHALNLRGHHTSDLADLAETRMRDYADDIGIAARQLGRPPVVIGWGMGALAALLYAQSRPVLGLVLLAPSPPAAALPRRPADHELQSVPDVYDAEWWGWRAPMDQLQAWMPDMSVEELSKMQELLAGARESGLARKERMLGVEVDPSRIQVPTLVIGAGLDDVIHPTEARRTADLLGATYEYIPGASHFGLVMGSETWPLVAGSILGWLEERRHSMMAAQADLVGSRPPLTMAEQKGMYGQKPTGPTDPDAWLAVLDDVRRPQLEELDARIRKVAPGLRRYVERGFLSYGRYSYRGRSGREGEWMCVALASNKQYISFYAGPIDLEPFAARLPKANLGRGCIRFKRVSDVDLDVIDEVIRASAAIDGQSITY